VFNQKPAKQPYGLQRLIDDLILDMREQDSSSDEYVLMTDQLVKLYALKEIDPPRRVSPDTALLVFGNLLGILIIVQHERTNVVTSKALGLLMRLR
jgi:hypothetical protein